MLYISDLEQAEKGRDGLSGSLMGPEFVEKGQQPVAHSSSGWRCGGLICKAAA